MRKTIDNPSASPLTDAGFQYLKPVYALVLLCGAVCLEASKPAAITSVEINSDHLYNLTNVWTMHLKFTPDQWEAMEPKGGSNPFAAFFGGVPGGFSMANSLSPLFMRQGDLNYDGRLSRDEFTTLAQKWFAAWDTNKTGKLGGDQIRDGLNSIRIPGGGGFGITLQAAEGKRNGLSSLMGIEFVYVHADLEFEGRILKNVAVRYKGNGTFMESRGALKRSLKIDLNKYVKGQKLGDVSKLTLQNNVTDGSWMNEVLAYRLYRDAGVPAPRTAYSKVFITVPGKYDRKYFGLYSISEDVDQHFEARFFKNKTGAIFKPVTPALFDYQGSDWLRYNQSYAPKTELSNEQKQVVMDLSRLVTEATDTEFAQHVGHYIDLPEFARFMAVMVWLSNHDSILGTGQNFYLYLHPKTKLLTFIPWDQDHSFGQFPFINQTQRDHLSMLHPWMGDKPFLERMFKLETFAREYHARMEEFCQTIFKSERLAQQVDELASVIRSAVQEESESKLEKFDKAVAGETLIGRGIGLFGNTRIKPIKPFTVDRTMSILGQIARRSEGQVPGNFGFMGGVGPGMIFCNPLQQYLDVNKDSKVTEMEFTSGFNRLFHTWNTDKSGILTQEQLRLGIEKDLSPFRGGMPTFGPPTGTSGFSSE